MNGWIFLIGVVAWLFALPCEILIGYDTGPFLAGFGCAIMIVSLFSQRPSGIVGVDR